MFFGIGLLPAVGFCSAVDVREVFWALLRTALRHVTGESSWAFLVFADSLVALYVTQH
jgi:hypothetical protein